jgi:hypothetical protein
MTDDEWQKLHEGFDTHQLLDAVSDLDTLRGVLSDDGLHPPEIRDRLFRLHELAMAVVNEGSESKAAELFDLAIELEDEAFTMLEAIGRIHESLSTLVELRPESLDYDDDEGS